MTYRSTGRRHGVDVVAVPPGCRCGGRPPPGRRCASCSGAHHQRGRHQVTVFTTPVNAAHSRAAAAVSGRAAAVFKQVKLQVLPHTCLTSTAGFCGSELRERWRIWWRIGEFYGSETSLRAQRDRAERELPFYIFLSSILARHRIPLFVPLVLSARALAWALPSGGLLC
jgi:hypothetical protein